MSNGLNSRGPYVQKPGDWRVWRDKFNEEKHLREEVELKLYMQEWKPEHPWRGVWRYLFGGYDKEANMLYSGKILTIGINTERFTEIKRSLWIILFGRFNYLRRCSNDRILFDIWKPGVDALRMCIEKKPLKIRFSRVDTMAPGC